jgi:hypothetical protein
LVSSQFLTKPLILKIGYLNFLGPFVVFFNGYLITYFSPLPKPSLNIIYIGAYFWERIGAWTTGAGFAVLLAPMGIVQLTEGYNDLLDFSRGYPQLMIIGVFTIASGVTLNALVVRFDVTRMKILYLSYPVLVLSSFLQWPIFLTDKTFYSLEIG